jgi:GNAT superfamily N-acetyltransferase
MNRNKKSSGEITGLIEENLYDLYRFAAIQGGLKTGDFNNFSWVNAYPACWPNYIFNTNFKSNTSNEIITDANDLITQKIVPPFWITLSDINSQSFQKQLTVFNFRQVMQWPGMAIGLDNLQDVPLIQGLDIRVIDDAESLKEWIKITEICLFNGKHQNQDMFANMMRNKKTRFVLGYCKGIPVATLLSYINNGIAGYFMVSTMPEFRNKGISKSIVHKGLSIAREEGCRLGTLQANEMSKNLYLSFGFKEYCTFDIYWKMNI